MIQQRLSLLLLFLYSIIHCGSLAAQDTLPQPISPDSNLVNVDSAANDSTPQVVFAKLDTLGLLDIQIKAEAKQLVFTVTPEGATPPNDFWALVKIKETNHYLKFENKQAVFPYEANFKGELLKIEVSSKIGKTKQKVIRLVHLQKNSDKTVRQQGIPLWWSIIPPLVAILLALILREVLLSLFLGILAGVWVINGMPLNPYDFMKALFQVLDTYILNSLMESSHLAVIIFSLMIGGVVALISRNGGMAGIVSKLAPMARGPKSTQFVAWLLGIAIFFDDYANSLIVGNTMRPLCDKYNISREKLSYIVDSTSAPVAAIAFITTWIGAELGYISDAMPLLEGLENPPGAYSVFLSSLQYSFYSFFTIIFMLLIVFTGKDFGAMYRAEHRARTTGQVFAPATTSDEEEGSGVDLKELEPVKGAPVRWLNGFLPVATVVFGTILGLIDTGMSSCYAALESKGINLADNSWGTVWSNIHLLESDGEAGTVRKMGILIGSADSYSALMWASLSAVVVTIFLTLSQRIMKVTHTLETLVMGFKTMLPALLILILAWALASTTEALGTAEYLTLLLGDSLNPYILPIVIFLLAGAIAFSTGSSWSTMAILYPIAIPMTWTICQNYGLSPEASMPILYNVIAVVLSASVFGDHCSPISDTTILSSLASSCRHIDHVNTQLPYAFLVGIVSILIGFIATFLGLPFIVNFALGVTILLGYLMLFGKKVDA